MMSLSLHAISGSIPLWLQEISDSYIDPKTLSLMQQLSMLQGENTFHFLTWGTEE